jgi:hypothetical protein
MANDGARFLCVTQFCYCHIITADKYYNSWYFCYRIMVAPVSCSVTCMVEMERNDLNSSCICWIDGVNVSAGQTEGVKVSATSECLSVDRRLWQEVMA